MKLKFALIGLIVAFSQSSFSKSIKCSDGFEYDSQTGNLTMDMNNYTSQLDSYLYKNYPHRKYYADDIYYNEFHGAYFKSDAYSTIKIYPYNNGEPAVSLVAARYGYNEKQIKFENCVTSN
ncbi:MAG: hypothetical protein ACXVBK_16705 [Flavisolibacter sp.]